MLNKQTTHESIIAILSIMSRILVLLLGKVVSCYFQRFDLSTSLSPIKSPFKYLESWDTTHFINISNHGYSHEHSLPFFPLVPLIVRTLNFSDYLTTAVILSNIAFIFSSLIFYKLSLLYFDERFSLISTIFFICNPASIIYSAYYTESIFTLIFLLALFYTIKGKLFRASVLFAVSTFCRSNAIFFVLFHKILYAPIILLPFGLFQLYSLLLIARHNASFRVFIPYSMIQSKYWDQGFLRFIRIRHTPNILIGLPVILISSFFLFQYFSLSFKRNSKKRMVENCRETTVSDKENDRNSSLKRKATKGPVDDIVHFYDVKVNLRYEKGEFADKIRYKPSTLSNAIFLVNQVLNYEPLHFNGSCILKLALILLFQVLMLVFFVHWNIAMRFIAYNPFIYWSCAYHTLKYHRTRLFNFTCTFFAVYGILYIIMFSCFYPPP
ncbi:uncharacterized protein VICG_01332 [Vittaforma corneae ATCC 50505]|uniref:GPI mannosyltransferase 2 n=1 Tax=Vittaforma corneae (strain ATCC 50505) TaxID=993615 RepID=L2GLU3_VITCO|nr:uncharacterized protein VICG_01332 [Vittaforma corneae ATCC 50505]ELA41584.1 hypothetical protein VICG_01332 [Vittaforma corneae ATCC 50505]